MANDFYTNFGIKHAIIEITEQTKLQRRYFDQHNEGNGTNTTATKLFQKPFTNAEIKKQTIDHFKTDTIQADLNPDFKTTSIKYQSLNENILFVRSNLNDKPNQFGPNIGTLGINNSGQPQIIPNRRINTSITYEKGKGFGFTVDSNTYGSHIDSGGNTTFGNYLSRKYDNEGLFLIKKGESIDHEDLNYEN